MGAQTFTGLSAVFFQATGWTFFLAMFRKVRKWLNEKLEPSNGSTRTRATASSNDKVAPMSLSTTPQFAAKAIEIWKKGSRSSSLSSEAPRACRQRTCQYREDGNQIMAQKLYVGNLSYNTTEDTLRRLFAEFGDVESVNVITDRDTGRPKGFAFVEMATAEAAEKSISALNGKMVDDREIRVDNAKPQADRGRGGNRGRSRW